MKKYSYYIFDVDGTIYPKRKMQIMMAGKLLGYYLPHIVKINELFAIYKFRKLREKEEYKEWTVEKLANSCLNGGYEVISRWMYKEPLEVLAKCRHADVAQFLNNRPSDVKLVIYSDYPASDKLEAMGIHADYIFTSEDEEITSLKPHKATMEYILSCVGGQVDDYLYVGDRDCKDGASARMVGMDYLDICDFRKEIACI